MKKSLFRAASALLILCLCLGLSWTSGLAEGSPLPVDTNNYPTPVDASLTCDGAFERANERYAAGKYLEAESYYRFSLKHISHAKRYTKGDVCNNLVLAFLQQEKNDDAYTLCRYMLEEDLAKSDRDACGYMLNMLVCAHAKSIPAAQELQYALQHDLFSFDTLYSLADKQPGPYTKLLAAMLYNVVYMDMEYGTAEGGASYGYYQSDRIAQASGAEIMEDLSAMLTGFAGETTADDRETAESLMPREEYLQFLADVLDAANDMNYDTYGASDPDIDELIDYLYALISQP